MAGEKMTEDNPNVEDLNDPRRPSALAGSWNGLFRCGEYWTAYENVKEAEGEDRAASVLHRVCQATYETTKKFVEDLMQTLIIEVSHGQLPDPGAWDQRKIQTLGEFLSDKDEAETILRSLSQRAKDGSTKGKDQFRKAISQLLKSRSPPTALSQAVRRTQGELEVSPELVQSFTDQLMELVYYMRVQEIKMVVDFECKAGTRLNPALYEVESGKAGADLRSRSIKAVMRPALLRHEHGPVLCKGEVELEASPRPTAAVTAVLRPQQGDSSTAARDGGAPTDADLAVPNDEKERRSAEEDRPSAVCE